MPEKPSVFGFDKCNRCSAASDGPVHGPSSATHAEICCLYSLSNQEQYNYDHCKDCLGLQLQKQPVGPAYCEPHETSSGLPQAGTLDLAAGCETEPAGTGPSPRTKKSVKPRLRHGFEKFTIEIRPPKFKKKLWFGTYTEEEIGRASDAVNYYMGYNNPYVHPDSLLLFTSKPLKGIKFEDLQASCDDWIQVGVGRLELKYKYFAKQVKEVIHCVTGKRKKSASTPLKRDKCKVSPSPPRKRGLYNPAMPSGAGPTTSSGKHDHQLPRVPSPEADSHLSAMHPSTLAPPAEMPTDEEQMQIDALLKSNAGKDEAMGYTLERMFAFDPVDSPYDYVENGTMEEEDFPSETLWTFQNEEPPKFLGTQSLEHLRANVTSRPQDSCKLPRLGMENHYKED